MESGIFKAVLLFLPVLGYIVWQIVSLHRDPELRQASSRNDGHGGNNGDHRGESSQPDSGSSSDSKG